MEWKSVASEEGSREAGAEGIREAKAEAGVMRIGILSDTHGLLRPEALRALRGADHILHAGDVGDPLVLEELGRLAPVTAVRGNMDRGSWAATLPAAEGVEIGGTLFYVLHDLSLLDLDPASAGIACVVSGHTHRAEIREDGGVLYLNPGSAGPGRSQAGVTLIRAEVRERRITARILPLLPAGRAR